MSRPTAGFKMSKNTKIYLARTWNRPLVRQRKDSFIMAEIKSKEVVRTKRDRPGDV